jgi:sulfur-oxidizing protein SoxY
MKPYRRVFLKLTSGIAALAAMSATSLMRAGEAFSAQWNKTGFEGKAVDDALKSLGASNIIDSKDIVITAPDIAENGAVVPIAVTSKIPNTQSISIIAEKNPFPLAATFDIAGSDAYISTRVKMGQTSNIRALIKADGKFYSAVKEVKITIGGCG